MVLMLGDGRYSGTGTWPGVQAVNLRDMRPGEVCELGQLGDRCLVQVQNVIAEGGPVGRKEL